MLADYHKEVGKLMESELIGLGLLDKTDVKNQNPEQPLYKKYFMHGTSHFLGLGCARRGPVERADPPRAWCFTVEPGIYIREEKPRHPSGERHPRDQGCAGSICSRTSPWRRMRWRN